jgi:hypothetical protein
MRQSGYICKTFLQPAMGSAKSMAAFALYELQLSTLTSNYTLLRFQDAAFIAVYTFPE